MQINNLKSSDLKLVSEWLKYDYMSTFDETSWVMRQTHGTSQIESANSETFLKLVTAGVVDSPQVSGESFQSRFDLPSNFEIELKIFPLTSFAIHWKISDVTTFDANGRPVYTAGRSLEFQQNQGLLIDTIAGVRRLRYVGQSITETPTEPTLIRIMETNNRVTVKIDGKTDISYSMLPTSIGGNKMLITNGSVNFFGFGSYNVGGRNLSIYNIKSREI